MSQLRPKIAIRRPSDPLLTFSEYGAQIKNSEGWPLDHQVFNEISPERAEEIFEIIAVRFHQYRSGYDMETLENIFIFAVGLEKNFELRRGSVTPTSSILSALGKEKPEAFEVFGNWAGENRGNNPYTPFGYRSGFRTYQELLDHRVGIEERQKADLETARIIREQKKALKS